jgi:hypothetical protein
MLSELRLILEAEGFREGSGGNPGSFVVERPLKAETRALFEPTAHHVAPQCHLWGLGAHEVEFAAFNTAAPMHPKSKYYYQETVHDGAIIEATAHAGMSARPIVSPPAKAERGFLMFGFFRTHTSIKTLQPRDVQELRQSGKVTLVDVREPAEWRAERIAGSVNVPLSCFEAAAVRLPKDKPIVPHEGCPIAS